ncbi:DUF4238 domain-containing protein [Streptomyces sp. Rer75]|uniref:DUF4238 domain-containing protein n=1 Tax=Streptomyces sp. Rer75 TaxID=2750011 RepID=UPI0015D05510|nr:DUF4238 domain-containing protein [Streptomyces sp. Rer75]QLH19339.1 DUF4238 domain-containing protein [Streptomyces sp. Rer75]
MRENTPKDHHLVPRLWLREFTEDGHLIGRWRSGAEHRTPVRAAAMKKHFNTDRVAEGAQRAAVETFLAREVDDRAAPVLRAIRRGQWPLAEAERGVLVDTLAWQLVRTQAFRSWDEQVGTHLFPMFWAAEAVGRWQARLGRELEPWERVEVFWIAYHQAPDVAGTGDPRSPLRAALRAFQHAQAALNAPGRELVLLRADVPLLVLSDSGVTVRRKDGTYSITPPLLPATAQLLAPVSPTHLLISAPPTTRYQHGRLTRRMAAKANRGAAAWCQEAVYRLPSMPWPPHLHLADAPLHIPAPRLAVTPSDGPATSPAIEHLHVRHPGLRALLEQLSTDAD